MKLPKRFNNPFKKLSLGKKKPRNYKAKKAKKAKSNDQVYTSVKTRSTRPFFNQAFGASARADFAVDRFRYYFLGTVTCLLFLSLFVRALYIQIINSDIYNEKFEYLNASNRIIPTHRGMIVDRNNLPLAIDSPLSKIVFNPYEYAKAYYELKKKLNEKELSPEQKQQLEKKLENFDLKRLAQAVNIDVKTLKNVTKIKNNIDFDDEEAVEKALPSGSGSRYLQLIRSTNPDRAQQIVDLKFNGVYKEDFDKRFYPQSHPSSQLLGFMGRVESEPDKDPIGRTGLELKFEESLAGKQGVVQILRDGRREGLKELRQVEEEKMGEDLHLTIDSRLQFLLYQELERVGREQQSLWSSGMVVDVETGEVLAMSTWPSYDANNLNEMKGINQRNRPISDNFEPGSVMKPFTIAAAFKNGNYSKRSTLDASPGYININGYKIADHENLGTINFTEILKYSSNVGTTKIALALPSKAISDIQRDFGFGELTTLGLPTEEDGIITTPRANQKSLRATMSYGYGLQVTLAQLAQAYATLGSGGVLRPLSIIKSDKPVETKQVLDEKHALDIVEMMESVTHKSGTAPKAAIDGYRVAGKTGTSRLINPKGGYYMDKHRTIFVGVAPVTRPRFVTAILVENPQKNSYAGDVAAPVFRNVMKEVLRLYNIPLDKPLKTK